MSKILQAARHVDAWYVERTGFHFPFSAAQSIQHLLEGHVLVCYHTTQPGTGLPAWKIFTQDGYQMRIDLFAPSVTSVKTKDLYDTP